MTSASSYSTNRHRVRGRGAAALLLAISALACSPLLAAASSGSVSAVTAASAQGTPRLEPSEANRCEPQPSAGVVSGRIPRVDTDPCPAAAPTVVSGTSGLPFTGLALLPLLALGALLLGAGVAVRWLGWRRSHRAGK